MATSLDEALEREAALIAERDGLVKALRSYRTIPPRDHRDCRSGGYDQPHGQRTTDKRCGACRNADAILSKYPTEG